MIKNIIFDWSGTILDDFHNCYAANMRVLKRLGREEISIERFKKEFELPYMLFYSRYTDVPQTKISSMFLEEIERCPVPKTFPGIRDLLVSLQKNGKKISILSVNNIKNLKKDIKQSGLDNLFENVIGDMPDKKKSLKMLLESKALEPEETVFVGDMVHDIAAGQVNNVMTVAVCWGYDTKEALQSQNPDYVIDDIIDLQNILH